MTKTQVGNIVSAQVPIFRSIGQICRTQINLVSVSC
jgi:hypothetical protein